MDRLGDLNAWLIQVSTGEWAWHAKRLSANDTTLSGGHQAGFYLPREFALAVAEELAQPTSNPRRRLRFNLVSHGQASVPSLIYYNSRVVRNQQNGRNEFRVTGFGGQSSVLQDPESTGAILFTAWQVDSDRVEAWLADSLPEEEAIEAVLGTVEPGTQVVRYLRVGGQSKVLIPPFEGCEPDIAALPPRWLEQFPTGQELNVEAVRRAPGSNRGPDDRLLDRYRCEYGIFKVVEAAHTLPHISAGFGTVDAFLGVALTTANRRKSRAGHSLELHLARIFTEEGVQFEAGAKTEGNRRPDFIFPSLLAYRSGIDTRMLAVKTSVKERWRQVLDEAGRIPRKHLFTLSEGVSPGQFRQMEETGLQLVVPRSNIAKFPRPMRGQLMTLAQFVALVR